MTANPAGVIIMGNTYLGGFELKPLASHMILQYNVIYSPTPLLGVDGSEESDGSLACHSPA